MEDKAFPFEPLSNYIIIGIIIKEESMILIPDTAKRNVPVGKVENVVVAVSKEKEKDGTPMVRTIKIGDSVLLSPNVQHTGWEVKIQGNIYIICRETDVAGILLEGWDEGNYEEKKIIEPNLKLVN